MRWGRGRGRIKDVAIDKIESFSTDVAFGWIVGTCLEICVCVDVNTLTQIEATVGVVTIALRKPLLLVSRVRGVR